MNLTYAPPSLSRGKISVTFIGRSSGMAVFTRRIGSRMPKEDDSNRLSKSDTSLSDFQGRMRTLLSLRGKISEFHVSWRAGDGSFIRRLTIEKENGFIGLCSDMTTLVSTFFGCNWGNRILGVDDCALPHTTNGSVYLILAEPLSKRSCCEATSEGS